MYVGACSLATYSRLTSAKMQKHGSSCNQQYDIPESVSIYTSLAYACRMHIISEFIAVQYFTDLDFPATRGFPLTKLPFR